MKIMLRRVPKKTSEKEQRKAIKKLSIAIVKKHAPVNPISVVSVKELCTMNGAHVLYSDECKHRTS